MSDKAVASFIDDIFRRRVLLGTINHHETSPLFSGLEEHSVQSLLSSSFIQSFPAGKQIVQQGDNPSHLYIIIEGSIKTLRYGSDGEVATIRMLKSGETFMEAVIFMGGISPINAVTISDSRLLMINADSVRRHALSDAQFACNLLKIVTRHYKNALQQIDSIVMKNPVESLGYYFLKQHLEQGSETMEIVLPFQKSIIANHLGMTPETFSRTLKHIRKMGIEVDHEKITLLDAYALCHFCDPDTAHNCPQFKTKQCPQSCESTKCHH